MVEMEYPIIHPSMNEGAGITLCSDGRARKGQRSRLSAAVHGPRRKQKSLQRSAWRLRACREVLDLDISHWEILGGLIVYIRSSL
jgi:hypothetical protein